MQDQQKDINRHNFGHQAGRRYSKTDKAHDGIDVFHDYRELLQSKAIDVGLSSTPDHCGRSR